ncbi:hypothetical protein EZS27_025182 [termite gut metagenome]|uniref:Outer membrane protein beta-barrel domain-containing protein n=1 Tax=termite gut metagenome TaxID=433724 RepID=A0A5J4QWQ5_9ZZZZ
MKKIVSILVAVVCVGWVMPVRAQIQLGIKGGLNLAGAPSTNMDENLVGNATGFFIGPMLDITIPIIGIGVDGAVMYSQKGNKFSGESIMQKGIEVPVNLKYSLGFGSLASIFVAAGPSAFFNWNSGTKELPIEKSNNDYKPFELSFNIGAGVKALKHLQIGINYNIPVTNSAIIRTVGATTSESSFKTRVWQASFAYMF